MLTPANGLTMRLISSYLRAVRLLQASMWRCVPSRDMPSQTNTDAQLNHRCERRSRFRHQASSPSLILFVTFCRALQLPSSPSSSSFTQKGVGSRPAAGLLPPSRPLSSWTGPSPGIKTHKIFWKQRLNNFTGLQNASFFRLIDDYYFSNNSKRKSNRSNNRDYYYSVPLKQIMSEKSQK